LGFFLLQWESSIVQAHYPFDYLQVPSKLKFLENKYKLGPDPVLILKKYCTSLTFNVGHLMKNDFSSLLSNEKKKKKSFFNNI
jgi:hypothetical protein